MRCVSFKIENDSKWKLQTKNIFNENTCMWVSNSNKLIATLNNMCYNKLLALL